MRNKLVLAVLAVFVQATFAQEVPSSEPASVAPGSAPPVVEIAPPPAPEPAPVAPAPAPAVVEIAPPPKIVSEPEPPVEAPAPVVQDVPRTSHESSSDVTFNFGVRAGAGISQFRDHVALIPNPELYKAVKLAPSLSASAGLAFQIGINDIFAIAPELQYTFYSASNDLQVEDPSERYHARLYEVGAYVHTFEIPLLARFYLSPIYVELGPQLGFNLYSKFYEGEDNYSPEDLGLVAFSAACGAGAKLGNTLVGVRGSVGFLKYAKETGGIPWNVQLGITQFVF
jgi:hypothetical protein